MSRSRSALLGDTRSVQNLLSVDDPAWPELVEAVVASAVTTTVLTVERAAAEQTLYRLQVTTPSVLGALASEGGEILVDHGWLRLLCGGHDGIPSLASANQLGEPAERRDDFSPLRTASSSTR